MIEIKFNAKIISASKNSRDNYYMVGLADHKTDYENYIIFQKSIKLDADDDPEADLNGLYAECNGDRCYNCCKSAKLTKDNFSFVIKDSLIHISLADVKLNKKFIDYSSEIFGELLEVDINEK